MEKLYIQKENGNYRPTELTKELLPKVGDSIDIIFNELLDKGLDIVEAQYVINHCLNDIVVSNLLKYTIK